MKSANIVFPSLLHITWITRRRFLAAVAVFGLALAACSNVANDQPEQETQPEEAEPGPRQDQDDATVFKPQPGSDPLDSLFFQDGWARVPDENMHFGGEGDQHMNAVSPGGTGIIAAGFTSIHKNIDAAVWFSNDALHWDQIDAPLVFGGAGEQVIYDLVSTHRGIIAAGYENIDGDQDGALWFSGDGRNWLRLPGTLGSLGGNGIQTINAIIDLEAGYVAVGSEEIIEGGNTLEENEGEEDDASSVYTGEIRAAVWRSSDGFEWVRVPHDERVFGGRNFYASMADVVRVGSALLAVGTLEKPGINNVDTAIWASNDEGRSWTRITNSDNILGESENFRYQIVSEVVYFDRLFMMAGSEQNITGSLSGTFNNVVVWTSADGLNWARSYDHKPDFEEQFIYSLSSSRFGLWAGGLSIIGDQSSAAIWFSETGEIWEKISISQNVFGGRGVQQINSLTEAGHGMVAVGTTSENGNVDAAVWIYVPGR